MLSRQERAFLQGKITANSKYLRILKWRIRKKLGRMQEDVELAKRFGIVPKSLKEPNNNDLKDQLLLKANQTDRSERQAVSFFGNTDGKRTLRELMGKKDNWPPQY